MLSAVNTVEFGTSLFRFERWGVTTKRSRPAHARTFEESFLK